MHPCLTLFIRRGLFRWVVTVGSDPANEGQIAILVLFSVLFQDLRAMKTISVFLGEAPKAR